MPWVFERTWTIHRIHLFALQKLVSKCTKIILSHMEKTHKENNRVWRELRKKSSKNIWVSTRINIYEKSASFFMCASQFILSCCSVRINKSTALNWWPLPLNMSGEDKQNPPPPPQQPGQVKLAACARALVRAGGVHIRGEASGGAVWPLLPCGRRPSPRVYSPGRRYCGRRDVGDALRRHQAAAVLEPILERPILENQFLEWINPRIDTF